MESESITMRLCNSFTALMLAACLVAAANGATIPIGSTGQSVSGGLDNNYLITADNTGLITTALPVQAFVVTSPPTAWAAPIPGTTWIGPSPNQLTGYCSCSDSDSTYQTTFSLAGLNPSTASLNLSMLVDNDVTVVLNGNTVYTNGTFLSVLYATPFSFAVNSDFVVGTNTLDFIVGNGFGPTGLDASISGNASPVPEPSAPVLCFGGLLAVGLLRFRGWLATGPAAARRGFDSLEDGRNRAGRRGRPSRIEVRLYRSACGRQKLRPPRALPATASWCRRHPPADGWRCAGSPRRCSAPSVEFR